MGSTRRCFIAGLGLEKARRSLFADLEFDFTGLGLYLSEYILGCANPHNGAEGLQRESATTWGMPHVCAC